MRPATKEQIQKCREDFIHHYRTHLCKIKTDPLNFDYVQDFESLFTNLRVIDTSQQQELDYDDIIALKIGEKQDRRARRLLAEGEAGAGKTTLCAKIAWDWLNGNGFKQFELVLIVPLRDIENNMTVGEIAKAYLSDDNTTSPEQFEKYCYDHPETVLIIFDGLDEFKGDVLKQLEDFIVKTLRSEHLLVCTVLVTTRPWRSTQFRGNDKLMTSYRFIRVEGFRKENIPGYIGKFFGRDKDTADGLIALMKENVVIAENMSPYPIYTAMLCILWRESSVSKRQIIGRLQTFSQLFQEMVPFLINHFFSKDIKSFTHVQLDDFYSRTTRHLEDIGKTAFEGLQQNQLSFPEQSFSHCKEAVETGCKVGVISREMRIAPKQEREQREGIKLLTSILFPHKLFQEYLTGMYLASLFVSSRSEFDRAVNGTLLPRADEFRYVLYFTVAQNKLLGIDIVKRVTSQNKIDDDFLVDITFESQNQEAADIVERHFHSTGKMQKIDIVGNDKLSTHTALGYFFILKQSVRSTFDSHSFDFFCGREILEGEVSPNNNVDWVNRNQF